MRGALPAVRDSSRPHALRSRLEARAQPQFDAALLALDAEEGGHLRVTVCGPGNFDTTLARKTVGWKPLRSWPTES
jgi:hypothetical protein